MPLFEVGTHNRVIKGKFAKESKGDKAKAFGVLSIKSGAHVALSSLLGAKGRK